MNANFRIEVFPKGKDSRGDAYRKKMEVWGIFADKVIIVDNYLINIDLDENQQKIVSGALINPVLQSFKLNEAYCPENFDYAIEIGYLPGVTDNVAHTVTDIIKDCIKVTAFERNVVFTTKTYFVRGNLTKDQVKKISQELYNPLIQRESIKTRDEFTASKGFANSIPVVDLHEDSGITYVDLNIDNDNLIKLGKHGILNKDNSRRGPLALDLDSMNVIKEYFDKDEKRKPTDIEMESIAQTWSEHCKHTIFSAQIDDDVEGIFKSRIKAATDTICRSRGDDNICLSVFSDNAGGIEFDENYIISDKVETHNSPSALDPFGGSITGIVGVNRDEMGFGLGAKPIANRYGFCFADPDNEKPLYRTKDEDSKLLSPRRIMEGVIQGVNVGGNCSGIPTPQGFVRFHERFKAKPLVFVGTVGLLPKEINGKSSVKKRAMPGDLVVIAGGRVGRDGIHGATFSSEALSSGSPATAVQIGDPITQKKMSDAIVKEARDMDLYHSITDNGAGGLSCSVAEMAKESGGFIVDLEKIPLKYPGLAPWQIWISESQERMTFSIPQKNIDIFLKLMEKRGVEAVVIGEFTASGRGIVKHRGEEIFNLDMDFLHDGLPKKIFTTELNINSKAKPQYKMVDIDKSLPDIMNRLNIASFEFISNQYDYEVQGNSVLKPLQGKGNVNTNVTVIRPIPDSKKGVALSQGLFPEYSEADPYNMAAASIDTAVRNAVSAGCSLEKMALLDNFCWCDSTNSERLGQLTEAARACYDYAVAYGTPYVSGKDSMFNDFKGYDENFNEIEISVPPTLLISSIGVIDDVEKCQSIDFKFAGDLIYLLGDTSDELCGSEYYNYLSETIGEDISGGSVPSVDAKKNILLYESYLSALDENIIASSISIERGGLAAGLLKSSIASEMGFEIDIDSESIEIDEFLYSESQGRLLVSVDPSKKEKFENTINGKITLLGKTINESNLIINHSGKTVFDNTLEDMTEKYKSRFENY